MSIENERKAFQKFWDENCDFENHDNTYFDEKTQSYENDFGEDTQAINISWSAWQASANRQGYKLVPVETTDHMKCVVRDFDPDIEDYANMDSDDWESLCSDIYKAMIGACDDH